MRNGWVLDRLLRSGGLDVLWPDVTGTLLEMGFQHADIQRAMGGVKHLAAMPRAWHRLGRHHLRRADDELAKGHTRTAAETYHRAAGCFVRARWGFTGEARTEVYRELDAAYDKVIELGPDRIERVVVNNVPGLLHLPDGPGPHPAVVLYPGMDMTKEYLPVPGRNIFAERGLAVLVLDPPGHGAALERGVHLRERNAEQAGSAAVDLLQARPEVDPDRIGVFGISLGSYFAVSLCTLEPRIRAGVSFEGGVFYDKVRFIQESQPTFGVQLAQMTGLTGDALHEVLRGMTMDGREGQVTVPYLIATGEEDELCPLADVERLHAGLGGPKHLIVHEGENHVLGGVAHEALRECVDWLTDNLSKKD